MRSPYVQLYLCIYLLYYGCTCGIWKFLDQGRNMSHGCNLGHSCDNTRSFNPLCQTRDQTWATGVTWVAAVRFFTHWATVRNPAQAQVWSSNFLWSLEIWIFISIISPQCYKFVFPKISVSVPTSGYSRGTIFRNIIIRRNGTGFGISMKKIFAALRILSLIR